MQYSLPEAQYGKYISLRYCPLPPPLPPQCLSSCVRVCRHRDRRVQTESAKHSQNCISVLYRGICYCQGKIINPRRVFCLQIPYSEDKKQPPPKQMLI